MVAMSVATEGVLADRIVVDRFDEGVVVVRRRHVALGEDEGLTPYR